MNPCSKPKLSRFKTAFIVAGALGITFLILILIILFCRRREKPLKYEKSNNSFQEEEDNPNKATASKNTGKLHFVRNDRERFELEELLRASAEILGGGSFGSSYKAVLFSGQNCVVRRIRQMSNIKREDFYEHMRRLGRLSHRNLLPLVAFYYRKEEKLLVTDYVENGSLASHLHSESFCTIP